MYMYIPQTDDKLQRFTDNVIIKPMHVDFSLVK